MRKNNIFKINKNYMSNHESSISIKSHVDALIESDGGLIGVLRFRMAEIELSSTPNDSVGSLIQSWLVDYTQSEKNLPTIIPNPKTQESPDYFITNIDAGLHLEIKVFRKVNSPAFDIMQNFSTVKDAISDDDLEKLHLDADYLIFEWDIVPEGIKVTRLFLQKVWEICGPSKKPWHDPITVHRDITTSVKSKKGVTQKIRPVRWFESDKGTKKAETFTNKKEMVEAIKKTKITRYIKI
jgi:hypothetical protein